MLSGLGDVLSAANQRRRRPASKKEEDEAVGDAGRPSAWARLGRSGDRWRGFGACRRGEGEAVAVVELVGGGGSVWVSSGKRAR